MQKKRKFFIMTVSIGEGHSQAARAIAETIKQVHPDDAVRVLDFLSRDVLSIDHVLKESYLKMIRIFPEMYDSLYSNSQNRHLGATFQSLGGADIFLDHSGSTYIIPKLSLYSTGLMPPKVILIRSSLYQ